MRFLLALICLTFAGAAVALETARALAAAGAPQLALARVVELQPRERAAPAWAEWEALRFDLLVELGRYGEVLKRTTMLPDGMAPRALKACLLAASRAAAGMGDGASARLHAARVLWRLDPDAAEMRAARLAVIEGYLAGRQGDAAFHAMLRFEQDHRPLEPGVAARFAEALLDLGLEREAVNWLARLEDGGALKLRVQLRAGIVSPEAAIAQSRARLAQRGKLAGGDAAYWLVLAEAAARKGDGLQRVEALEQLLNRPDAGAQAPGLWQAYSAEGQSAANRNQVLAGDDGAWAGLAARRQGINAVEARALLAWLARNGGQPQARQAAEFQLVASLRRSGLDYGALHLYADPRTDAGLDAKTRYLLGDIAEKRGMPGLAVRFWQGLPAPDGVSAAEWQLRMAEALWRGRATDAAVEAVRVLARTPGGLPEPVAGRAIALAREATAGGQPGAAEQMLAALLPVAGREDVRRMLHTLGGIAESAAQHARAADYYLRAALADGSRAADALALQSRLAAGINLARAGYRADAREQFQWLIRHSKDASQLEIARRELARP